MWYLLFPYFDSSNIVSSYLKKSLIGYQNSYVLIHRLQIILILITYCNILNVGIHVFQF